MARNVIIRALSIVIGVVIATVASFGYTYAFKFILISHHGGGAILGYLISSFLIVSVLVAIFNRHILLFLKKRRFLLRFLTAFLLATFILSSFLLITKAINEFARSGIFDIELDPRMFTSHLVISLVIGLTVQLLFLSRFTKIDGVPKSTMKLMLQVAGVPLLAILLNTAFHIDALRTSYIHIPEAQIVLLPHDLTGNHIRIVYEEGGTLAPVENDSLLFEIPSNGVLLIQNYMAENFNGRNYYALDKQGNRESISTSSYHISRGYNTRDGNYKWHFQKENGIQPPDSMKYENVYLDLDSISEDVFFEKHLQSLGFYESYDPFIRKDDLLNEFRHQRDRRFDSLTTALVNKSRESK